MNIELNGNNQTAEIKGVIKEYKDVSVFDLIEDNIIDITCKSCNEQLRVIDDLLHEIAVKNGELIERYNATVKLTAQIIELKSKLKRFDKWVV